MFHITLGEVVFVFLGIKTTSAIIQRLVDFVKILVYRDILPSFSIQLKHVRIAEALSGSIVHLFLLIPTSGSSNGYGSIVHKDRWGIFTGATVHWFWQYLQAVVPIYFGLRPFHKSTAVVFQERPFMVLL